MWSRWNTGGRPKAHLKSENQNKGDENVKEKWFVFYHGERELSACTVRGSFPGEIEATVELLAGENNIPQEDIRVAVEKR